MEERVATLVPIMQEARRQDIKCNIVRDNLYVNGNKYNIDSLHTLPPSLQPETISTTITKDSVFFYSKHSPLSNFYPAKMEKESIVYNCVEQFYCSQRAAYFKDEIARQKILSTSNPVEQKRTKVIGLNEKEWQNNKAQEVMREGLIMKFTQNPTLWTYLMNTENRNLIEANPNDALWGAGLSRNNPKILDPKNWGTNLLGKLLEEIRCKLRTSE
jgi:hypothetical protein